eukprot:4013912-Pyramimonas_sp.AAC.1
MTHQPPDPLRAASGGPAAHLAQRPPVAQLAMAYAGRLVGKGEGDGGSRSERIDRRCYLMYVAFQRNVFVLVEQPMRSLFYFTPEFVAIKDSMDRIVTYFGAFGARSIKPAE